MMRVRENGQGVEIRRDRERENQRDGERERMRERGEAGRLKGREGGIKGKRQLRVKKNVDNQKDNFIKMRERELWQSKL